MEVPVAERHLTRPQRLQIQPVAPRQPKAAREAVIQAAVPAEAVIRAAAPAEAVTQAAVPIVAVPIVAVPIAAVPIAAAREMASPRITNKRKRGVSYFLTKLHRSVSDKNLFIVGDVLLEKFGNVETVRALRKAFAAL